MEVREGRHLAAIMFVDMVGYSARMQDNEPRAIAAVRGLWDLVRPILAERGGREVDLAGDGMLMEFPGALAAVRCAMRIQHVLHEQNRTLAPEDRVRTRAAVHLGDIEHRDAKIYGDGVNIAARLLPLSPPGGIAMSPHVRDQLINVLDQPLQRLGSKTLKNIKAPLEIWCITGPDCTAAELAAAKTAAQDEAADRHWSFGSIVLDERTLELSVEGSPVEMEKKALEVLTFLLHHAGEIVTKDEILEAVWPGRIVTESVLTKCISKIRDAIKDEDQSGIKTVHGFGYRLAIPVKVEAVAPPALPHFDFKEGDHPHLRPFWSLVRRLGQGGHGEVWLARHDKTREERVYKFALDPAHLASLKREITLSRVLNDTLGGKECFVRVLDWNLEQLPYFIECEYSKSGSLVDWATSMGGLDKIPLETRLDLAAQVAEALAAAHSAGVLHKDLKPSNIVVMRHPERGPGSGQIPAFGRNDAETGIQYRIKLSDFGSGGVLDPQRLAAMGITRMGFTRTVLDVADSTSGTPIYLAPEILAGQPWTSLADIYALGVVLYQLTVGDLHKTLAPGWEKDVPDEFLREDIAAAAAGSPGNRLPDASLLAQRLRTLDGRRTQRQAEKASRLEVERQQLAVKRFRVRFFWTAATTTIVAVSAAAAFLLWLDMGEQFHIALKAVNAAADRLEKSGQPRVAELLLRRAVYFDESFSFVVYPGVLRTRNHLAMLMMEQGRLAEAEDQFRQILSLTAASRVLGLGEFFGGGVRSYHYARFSNNYGECLRRAGKIDLARKILEGARPTVLDEGDEPTVRSNTESLRQVYRALGLKGEEEALPPAAEPKPVP